MVQQKNNAEKQSRIRRWMEKDSRMAKINYHLRRENKAEKQSRIRRWMEKDSRMAKINYHLRRENKASKIKAPPENWLINLRWNE